MAANTVREQLRRQLDLLPDDVVVEIADFTAFILARRQGRLAYVDWTESDWQKFAVGQLLRETDEIEYTLDDALAEGSLHNPAGAPGERKPGGH
jgi:hypothetical protein